MLIILYNYTFIIAWLEIACSCMLAVHQWGNDTPLFFENVFCFCFVLRDMISDQLFCQRWSDDWLEEGDEFRGQDGRAVVRNWPATPLLPAARWDAAEGHFKTTFLGFRIRDFCRIRINWPGTIRSHQGFFGRCFNQCWGNVTFWCGSVPLTYWSSSVSPTLVLMVLM